MRWAPGREGLTLRYSAEAEPVYRVVSSLGFSELVPARICGLWDGESDPRRFFRRDACDATLDLERVDEFTGYVGWVAYPSGVAATPAPSITGPDGRRDFLPWLVADSPRALQRALRVRLAEVLGEPHLA
jgi:hypothetical protein